MQLPMSGKKCDVYFGDNLIKADATLEAIIPAGKILTEDEVLKHYFRGDRAAMDNSKYPVQTFMRASKNDRLVFDRLIIPSSSMFSVEVKED